MKTKESIRMRRLPNGEVTQNSLLYTQQWGKVIKETEHFFKDGKVISFDPGLTLKFKDGSVIELPTWFVKNTINYHHSIGNQIEKIAERFKRKLELDEYFLNLLEKFVNKTHAALYPGGSSGYILEVEYAPDFIAVTYTTGQNEIGELELFYYDFNTSEFITACKEHDEWRSI